MSTLNELAKECHSNARDKGFYDNAPKYDPMDRSFDSTNYRMTHFSLIAEEAMEGQTAARKGTLEEPCGKVVLGPTIGYDVEMSNVAEELADIIIRALDSSVYFGVDIEKAVQLKMLYNSKRPKMHGKLR